VGTAATQGGSHRRRATRRPSAKRQGADLWPESTWPTIKGALGVAAPDAVLREEIRHAVAPYVAAPWLTDELYLDPDDVRPVHAAEVRACARTLAEPARSAAHLGAQLPLPRSKETRLTRTLVRHLLPDHPMIAAAPGRRPLEPEELALLAERARGFRYRARRGPGRNLALTELVRRLTRVIEEHHGRGTATLGWDEIRETPCGRLYAVVEVLQPWLPGLENRTPRGLYDALTTARRRAR
jgi:hypothetical protein